MMLKSTLFILSLLVTTNVLAFPFIPTDYTIEKQTYRLVYSCGNGVANPIADFRDLEKIAEKMDCNNKTMDEYCGCIEEKFKGQPALTAQEQELLETEVGYFGHGIDAENERIVADLGVMQEMMSSYNSEGPAKGCLDISREGRNYNSYKRIQYLNKKALEVAESGSNEVPAYVDTRFLDKALATRGIILQKPHYLFDQERDYDWKFLKELAVEISKTDEDLLFDQPNDSESSEVLTDRQNKIKKFIENYSGSEQHNSALFRSLKSTMRDFGRNGQGTFSPANKKGDIFKNLTKAVANLGLSRKDLKNLREGKSVDDLKLRDKADKKKMNRALMELSEDICASKAELLLGKISSGRGVMSERKQGNYRVQGRSLLQQFYRIDPSSQAGVIKMMNFSSEQKRMFTDMARSFRHMDIPQNKKEEMIAKRISKRKDQLGRLWCQQTKIEQSRLQVQEKLWVDSDFQDAFVEKAAIAEKYRYRIAQLKVQEAGLESEIISVESSISHLAWKLKKEKEELSAKQKQLESDIDFGRGGKEEIRKRVEDLKASITDRTRILNEEQVKLSDLTKNSANLGKAIAELEKKTVQLISSTIARHIPNVFGSDGSISATRDDFRRIAAQADAGGVAVPAPQTQTTSPVPQSGIPYNEQYFNHDVVSMTIALGVEELDHKDAGPVVYGPVEADGTPPTLVIENGETFVSLEDEEKNLKEAAPPSLSAGGPGLVFGESGVGQTTQVVVSGSSPGVVVSADVSTIVKQSAEYLTTSLRTIEETASDIIAGSNDLSVPPEIGKEIADTYGAAINRTDSAMVTSGVKPDEKEVFLSKARSFERTVEPVIGDVDLDFKGEYSRMETIDEIVRHEVKRSKTAEEMMIPTSPQDLKPQTIFNYPVAQRPRKEATLPTVTTPSSSNISSTPSKKITKSERPKKKEVSQPSLSEGVIAERLAQSVSRRNTSSGKAKEKEIKVKKKESARVRELREEIDKERKVAERLEAEAASTTLKPEPPAQGNQSRSVASASQVNTTPVDVSTPSRNESRSGRSSSQSSRATASSSSLGGGSSTGVSNNVVEGRVEGGVIVNGEFISNDILVDPSKLQGVPVQKDFKISSSSSFDVGPLSAEKDVEGVPVVRSETFSGLAQREKEIFIQKELTKRKVNKLIIELEDGTNILVQSKIKLETRMKVADLNSFLDKVDE